MQQYLIGINLPSSANLNNLDAELARIEKDGFDACEINLSTAPLIIGGKVRQPVVDYVKGVLERHSLRYTAHAGYGLDLRNLEEQEMHRAVLFSSIDVCAALGINPLNLHYEVQTIYPAREEAFLKAHLEAAEYSMERGVQLNVENIEVEYAYKAAEFVRTVNHPNLGMTLDLGHLFLSSRYFGYDFMESVRDCLPLLRHIHINDNTGDFEPLRLTDFQIYNTLDRGYRFTFGRGDIHVPPFWGEAPIREALPVIKKSGYSGIWMCEYYNQSFHPFNRSVQETVRSTIESA
jgi:Sugar phosphate isomerases/epimerases